MLSPKLMYQILNLFQNLRVYMQIETPAAEIGKQRLRSLHSSSLYDHPSRSLRESVANMVRCDWLQQRDGLQVIS